MVRIYLSHSIRGKHGKDATVEQMEYNNELAKSYGRQLRLHFSKVDFYIPGEHDEFVLIAYLKGYLAEKQVLDVDCEIVSRCNLVVALAPDGYISRGMRVEIDYAVSAGIPVQIVDGYTVEAIDGINRQLVTMMR